MKTWIAWVALACALLGGCGGSAGTPATPVARAASQGVPPVLDTATLMNWAPTAYPQYFNGAFVDGVASVAGYGTFTYRYWSATGNYVGVLPGGDVYVYGPVSANQVEQAGSLQGFTCTVYDCGACSGPTASSCNAAMATAQDNALCGNIVPFSWEIGDASGPRLSGSRGGPAPGDVIPVASASKWIYGTYVVQARGGAANLSASDIAHLHFTSGYTNLGNSSDGLLCPATDTVDQCLQGLGGTQDPRTVGRFDYDSGHMEKHASAYMGLGSAGVRAITAAVQAQLGTDIALTYFEPDLAGGVATSTSDYARMLRKILAGNLKMRDALGMSAVCTNASVPGCNAVPGASPLNVTGEAWHYAMGHWVEDDPSVGDGAFSSAGAFGFYPWIDKAATFYGIIARDSRNEAQAGVNSALCGRLIRRAWFTGIIQAGAVPG